MPYITREDYLEEYRGEEEEYETAEKAFYADPDQ